MSQQEIQTDLIDKMNAAFGDDCYRFKPSVERKYLKIGCRYSKCPLDIWLNFTQTPDG